MSPLTLEFLPAAIAEARAAREWYEARNPGAARSFMGELDHAVGQILEAPERCRRDVHGTRRYPLRRFPFALVYRTAGTTITVVAVAHARRRPGYWKSR